MSQAQKPKLPKGWAMAGKYPVKQTKSPVSSFQQLLKALPEKPVLPP